MQTQLTTSNLMFENLTLASRLDIAIVLQRELWKERGEDKEER